LRTSSRGYPNDSGLGSITPPQPLAHPTARPDVGAHNISRFAAPRWTYAPTSTFQNTTATAVRKFRASGRQRATVWQSGGRRPQTSGRPLPPPAKLRVQHVAEGVAQQVERQHGQRKRDPRRKPHPGRSRHEIARRTAKHLAQRGIGRRHPDPRNETDASTRMTPPTIRLAMTITTYMTFGSTCTSITRPTGTPTALAASMYASDRTRITAARRCEIGRLRTARRAR